jgi:hypothetical protein
MISAPSNIGRQSPLSPAGNLSPAAESDHLSPLEAPDALADACSALLHDL